jgi:outer membrane receptor protein involved in Fe transport
MRIFPMALACIYWLALPCNALGNDYMDLSLRELTSIKVEVASLFLDDSLDVASSTAILTTQDWQDRGIDTLGQALEIVPSVFGNTTWGGSEVISIRGYATELSVRGVAYSLDQIPLGSFVYANTGYFLPRMPLNLIKQVELIRGSGSALYGTDAFHGVMSFKLAQSEHDMVKSYAQLGTPDHQQVAITSSKHINHWQVHSGFAYEQDGNHDLTFSYTDPLTGNSEAASREQQYQNLSGFINASTGSVDNGKLSVLYFHNQYESAGFPGIGRQFFSGLASKFDIKSTSIAQQGDVSGADTTLDVFGIRHEFKTSDDLFIKNSVYAWQSKHEWNFDNHQYPNDLTFLAAVPTVGGTTWPCKANETSTSINPLFCAHTLYQGADEQRIGYSAEIKSADKASNSHWVIGIGYDELSAMDSKLRRVDENGNNIQYINNAYEGKTRGITHVLAQARNSFLDDTVLLTYGLRWDNYSDAGEHASPRLGLVHKLNSHWRQKILYGHAYRAPTAIEFYGSSNSAVGDVNLKPETIDSLEYVLIFSNPHYEIETVLFYSQWKDAIALVPSIAGSTTNQYKNIKENESKGLEIGFRRQYGNWSERGNFSYVQSKNVTDNIKYSAFPSLMASVNSEYENPSHKLRVGFWLRMMHEYALSDNTQENNDTNHQYARVDTYLKWPLNNKTELGMSIQNIGDNRNTLPSYYESENGLTGVGRIFKLNITHIF